MDTLDRVTSAESELIHVLVAAHADFTANAVEPKLFLDSLLARAQTLTDATGCLLEIMDGEDMACQAATGAAIDLRRQRHAVNGVAGTVARTGMLLRSIDTQTDERIDSETVERLGARSLVAAPIYSLGGLAGTLTVYSAEPDHFDDSAVQTIQVLAGITGMAMSRIASSSPTVNSQRVGLELVQYQALHDPMTELPNRTLLFDRLRQAIQMAHREREPLAVLAIDLDSFAQLNDSLGHEAGDEALRAFAACLKGTLRASDTIARIGPDELAVLLPGANAIGALGTANKVLRRLMHESVLSELEATSATIGIAIYPEHGEEADELLGHALEAIEQARLEGRSHRVYSE